MDIMAYYVTYFFRIVSSVLPACPLILDFLFLERLEAFLTSEEVQ